MAFSVLVLCSRRLGVFRNVGTGGVRDDDDDDDDDDEEDSEVDSEVEADIVIVGPGAGGVTIVAGDVTFGGFGGVEETINGQYREKL
ncbi:hypothetical protein BGZ83_004432 [Gryganskiella cystojenkinii]|nr:hypothetical protein BGZ83_004432 [Gryganskiella cystojenkinii]